MLLKISQNSQENTCARASFLIKLQASNFIKKETLAQVCFPVNFVKFFLNFFTKHLRWLLLKRCFINGLILKEYRIVAPQTLRQKVKTLLHNGHLGIAKIKNRIREVMFWPEMNKDIDNTVRTCEICKQYRKKQRDETFTPHEIPDTP